MSESNFMRRCMLRLAERCTVFRQNVGAAWMGKATPGPLRVTITHARLVEFGLCKGSSDIIGWMPVTIEPRHVGHTVAVFLAVETKGKGTSTTPEQVNFLERVAMDGGIAVLAREGTDSVDRLLDAASEGKTVWGRIHGALPRPRRQGEQPISKNG